LSLGDKGGMMYTAFELKTITTKPSQMPKAMILRSDKNSLSEASKAMQEVVKNRYVYQRALLDEVVYTILYSASERPLKERINFKSLDQDLKNELMSNGINLQYHFTVSTPDGRDILCRQIAGAMARRIVTYAKEGEDCYIDEHLGFIKLGSRVDVFLPVNSEVCVKMGQTTTGDQTIIAKLK